MKVTCQSCQSKYTIADDRVAGRSVKIKCRRCGTTIMVASGAAGGEAGDEHGPTGDQGARAYGELAGPGDDAQAAHQHHPGGAQAGAFGDVFMVHVADGDQRTMSSDEILAACEGGHLGAATLVWKEPMTDWLPIESVPELAARLRRPAQGAFAEPAGDEEMTRAHSFPLAAPQAAPAAAVRRSPGEDLFQARARASEAPPRPSAPPPRASAPPPSRASVPPPSRNFAGERGEQSVLFSVDQIFGAAGKVPPKADQASIELSARPPPSRRGAPGQASIDAIMNLSAAPAAGPLLSPIIDPVAPPPAPPPAPVPEPPPMAGPASYAPPHSMPPHSMPPHSMPPHSMPPHSMPAHSMPAHPGVHAQAGAPGQPGAYAHPGAPAYAPQRAPGHPGAGPGSYAPPHFAASASAEPPPKKGRGVFVAIAAAAALALAGGGALFAFGGEKKEEPTAQAGSEAGKAEGDEGAAGAEAPPGEPAKAEAPTKAEAPEAAASGEAERAEGGEESAENTEREENAPTGTRPASARSGAASKAAPKKDDKPDPKAAPEPAKAAAKPSEPEPPAASGPPKPFNRGAATSAVGRAAGAARGCKKSGGPTGVGRVSVTFAPSGSVSGVSVSGPIASGATGSCVKGAFRGLKIPPFTGSSVTIPKTVSIN